MPDFTWPPGLQENQITRLIRDILAQEVPSMLATSAFLLDGGNSPLVNASNLGNGVTLTAQSYEPVLSLTRTVGGGIAPSDLIGKVEFGGLASGENLSEMATSATILCQANAARVPGKGIPSSLKLSVINNDGFLKERLAIKNDDSVSVQSELFQVRDKDNVVTLFSVNQAGGGRVTLGRDGDTPIHIINGDEQAPGVNTLSMNNAPAAGVVRYLKVNINGINAVIPFLPR